eukprot:3372190-Alexandrium_andersonii.AAC.1
MAKPFPGARRIHPDALRAAPRVMANPQHCQLRGVGKGGDGAGVVELGTEAAARLPQRWPG